MNRTLWLLLLVIVGGGLLWWTMRAGAADRTTLAGADRKFAVPDTNAIGKIFLVTRDGARTILEREADHWIYNDQYRARPNAMKNLLEAVARIEIQYKPANAAVPTMVRNLATEGIKVEIYDRRDKLLKAYYVGGSTPDERGTYMILDGYEQPYVVSIPGWVGNVRFRYNLLGDDWRDRTAFNFDVANIDSLSVNYPKQRDKSFIIRREGNGFTIAPYYAFTPRIDRPIKEGTIRSYLAGFENLQAMRFINRTDERDSILRLVPFSIFTVTQRDGRTQQVKLWPYTEEQYIKTDTEGTPTMHTEYYYASLGENDFVLVQDETFKRVLWAYEFFYD